MTHTADRYVNVDFSYRLNIQYMHQYTSGQQKKLHNMHATSLSYTLSRANFLFFFF